MGLRSRLKKLLLGKTEPTPTPQDLPKPGQVVRQTGRPKPPPEKYRTTRAPDKPKRTTDGAKPLATPAKPEAATPKAAKGLSEEEAKKLKRQQRAIERAKRGTLQFLVDAGGGGELGEMHDHSERKYFVAHRGFSRLLEGLTDDGLVDFDHDTGHAEVTQAGRDYLS